MANVTIHKNCKFTPVTLNLNAGDSVDFTFQNPTTIEFSNPAFWNPSTASISADQTLTIAANSVGDSTAATAPTCKPLPLHHRQHDEHYRHEGDIADSADSCVITVSSGLPK